MKKISLKTLWRRLSGKKIGPEYHNIYHPDFEGHIEPAFEHGGKQYYRFINETNMKWGRYMILQTLLYEQNLRVDLDLLKGYVTLIKKSLTGKNGNLDLNLVYKIASQLESRCELAFEEDTTYRLASCIYFDDKEDLYSYDRAYNDKKITAWKEAKMTDFFYSKPMSEYLGLSGLSPQDLVTSMEVSRAILNDLTIEMQGP